jgi:nitrite reductase/ring-hydroxylating ferredoxin subunit
VTAERAVAAIDDLPPGTVRRVEVDGRRVCLANQDGEVFALDDRCLHKGGSLGDGRLHAGLVTCPLHWWRYDLRTGAVAGRPSERVATFPTRVADGRVLVTLPPVEPPRSWRQLLRDHARTGVPGPHAAEAPRRRPVNDLNDLNDLNDPSDPSDLSDLSDLSDPDHEGRAG